jgi:hypothetical protein
MVGFPQRRRRLVPAFTLAVPVLALVACGASAKDIEGPLTGTSVGDHISIGVPSGWVVNQLGDGGRSAASGPCQWQDAKLKGSGDSGPYVVVELVGAGCSTGKPQAAALNGFEGHYVTIEDAASSSREAAASSAAGSITVFSQPYTECTNSCRHVTEQVALVGLAHPDDPRFPTVMLRTQETDISAAQMQRLAAAVTG